MADAAAVELKRCTSKSRNWRCAEMIPVSDKRKTCARCRGNATRFFRTPHRKQALKEYHEKNKEHRAEYLAEYYRAHREALAAYKSDWNKTPKGRALQKRANARMIRHLANSLRAMLKDKHPRPVSLIDLGCFTGSDDVRTHFEATFEAWMSFANHGRPMPGNPPKTKWQIGHRIPQRLFDSSNLDDVKKCWHRNNLFAQCASVNLKSQDALILSDAELVQLRPLWPAAALNSLQQMKQLYRKIRQPKVEVQSDSDSEDI